MSDSVPLPPLPNLQQYKKLARDLQTACRSPDPGAVDAWITRWAETVSRLSVSAAAPALRQVIERRWQAFRQTHARALECRLADAQWFLATCHGFQSWPKFAGHIEALARPDSTASLFEEAADAIVAGDIRALEKQLKHYPDLVRLRSPREHRSTLLHYVSANGIENFRQKTPPNIVEIARLLLRAGADVNAGSLAYGGGSTTLGLAATSLHPEQQGVQLRLLELLLEYAAQIESSQGMGTVNLCLANGRGAAAELLAARGARLDLEGACGVGRFDLVRGCFGEDASLHPPGTMKQMQDGFAWACQFGRTAIVDFLLLRGMDLDTPLRHHGQTALHWAAHGGHADTVELLLQRGARVNARDPAFGGTPLGWALSAWLSNGGTRYFDVARTLVRAGADLPAMNEQIRADPRILAALRGQDLLQSPPESA